MEQLKVSLAESQQTLMLLRSRIWLRWFAPWKTKMHV